MSEREQASKAATPVSRAPRQKRSARTEDRLLTAAARVLDREGFDGATVPKIATEAKLSPASIYRRFLDKDDLLRAAVLRTVSAQLAESEPLKTKLAKADLTEIIEALIAALLKQHRDHPQTLRAVTRVLEADPASAFAKEATRLLRQRLEIFAQLLLTRRESIRHPDPDRAVRFAVVSTLSAIETAASQDGSPWRGALALSDKAFAAELARQLVAYLRRKP